MSTIWQLDKIIPLILESGKIASRYFGNIEKSFKEDDTIVTKADQEIEAFLTKELFDFAPQVDVIGEETINQYDDAYFHKALNGISWVIDPIDGTAPFAAGLPQWGISLGLLENGEITHGIIFLASLGEMFYTQGAKAFKRCLGADPIWWDDNYRFPKNEFCEIELIPYAHEKIKKGSIIALSQQIARFGSYDLPYQIQVNGSSVFNLAKLANGNFVALITKFKIWDFAAGLALLSRLGITSTFIQSGRSMGLRMDETTIDYEGIDRFACKETVVFARGIDATEEIRTHVKARR